MLFFFDENVVEIEGEEFLDERVREDEFLIVEIFGCGDVVKIFVVVFFFVIFLEIVIVGFKVV